MENVTTDKQSCHQLTSYQRSCRKVNFWYGNKAISNCTQRDSNAWIMPQWPQICLWRI